MKIFVIELSNIFKYIGFLEAENQAAVLVWLAENTPTKTRIIKINEGAKDGLMDLKEIFKKESE